MNKLHQSGYGWIGLTAGIVAYEVLCDPGETLSEAVDRYMTSRLGKAACFAATTLTAAHILNLIPEKYDPFVGSLAWKQNRLEK